RPAGAAAHRRRAGDRGRPAVAPAAVRAHGADPHDADRAGLVGRVRQQAPGGAAAGAGGGGAGRAGPARGRPAGPRPGGGRGPREAWRRGQTGAEDYARASGLAPVRQSRLPVGQHVPPEVVGAALSACDDSPAGKRDAALIAVLYSTGCRRAEVCGLALDDYDPGARSLRVRGKRDKERLVYLTPDALGLVERWLAVRGRAPGALFSPISKAGRLRCRDGRPVPLTGQGIAVILERRLTSAGASPRTAPDFRRTFIGELLDAGVDLATAQALVGHSSPATTARYDRRPEKTRRDAVDRLRLPPPRPLA